MGGWGPLGATLVGGNHKKLGVACGIAPMESTFYANVAQDMGRARGLREGWFRPKTAQRAVLGTYGPDFEILMGGNHKKWGVAVIIEPMESKFCAIQHG